MAVIGQTQSGKSTLVNRLLSHWQYLVILRTKTDTVRYDAQKIKRAADIQDPRYTAFELAPKFDQQPVQFKALLDSVWRQKGWTVYVDELYEIDKLQGLRPEINRLLTQGASKGITLVTGVQRPVEVTRWNISQAAHVLCFAQEGRDVKNVCDATTPRMKATIESLNRHEFVWYVRATRSFKVYRLDMAADVLTEVGGPHEGTLAHER